MTKVLLALLKIGGSVAIIAYLVYQAQKSTAFTDLRDQPKQWDLLAAASALLAASLLLTIVRWLYLVRALEIPFTFKDALRLGFVGYLFNLAPLGIVGGDLVKGLMLARENPGRRTKAFASIIVDRLIGLYLLIVIASIGVVVTGLWWQAPRNVCLVCVGTVIVTALSTVVVVWLLMPAFTEGRFAAWLCRWPRIGHHLANLIDAVRLYRRSPGVLILSTILTVGVHTFTTLSIYLIARGLPGSAQSLATHFVIVPVAMVAACFPLPMGPFEAALALLYASIPGPAGVAVTWGKGAVVALAYRILTVFVAGVGMCYYLGSRREVTEVLHEAEDGGDEEAVTGTMAPCR